MSGILRHKTLAATLGLGGSLFRSASERAFVRNIEDGLARVEASLHEQFSFADDIADASARYLMEAGGKLVRPALTLLTAQLGDGANDAVIIGAQAVEITHLASLYHDDVMDEAPLRRGVPSAHTVWDNSVAILTGDLLFSRASRLISQLGEQAFALQANVFERLCLGQLHETVGPKPGSDPIEHYFGVLSDKTGSLIACAAVIGVAFSNAPEEYRAPVEKFGERVGVAFQLVDDVLDLTGDAHSIGKTAGTDLRAGVPTLPLLYLRREADENREAAMLLTRLETSSLAASDPKVFARALAELREHPVTQKTLDQARVWAESAVDALAVLPEGMVKTSLTRFAETVVERKS